MRSHKHSRAKNNTPVTNPKGRGHQLLALGATVAIITGGVLTYEGIHNSEAEKKHGNIKNKKI